MHITLPITPIRLSVCPSVRPPIHHAPSTHPSPFLHVRHTFLPASLLSSIPSSPPSPLLSLSITSGIITHIAFSACCFCFLLTALHGLQAVRFPTGINPSPPAVEDQNFNPWASGKSLSLLFSPGNRS